MSKRQFSKPRTKTKPKQKANIPVLTEKYEVNSIDDDGIRFKEVHPDDRLHLKGGEVFMALKKEHREAFFGLSTKCKELYFKMSDKAKEYVLKSAELDKLKESGAEPPPTSRLTMNATAAKTYDTLDEWGRAHSDLVFSYIEDPSMSAEDLKLLKEYIEIDLSTKVKKAEKGHVKAKVDVSMQRKYFFALEGLQPWIDSLADCVLRLQKNEHSRLHLLVEAMYSHHCLNIATSGTPVAVPRVDRQWWSDCQTFVVKHDWLAAMGESLGTIGDQELVFPYPKTVFEFMVNGRCVIVLCAKTEIEHPTGVNSYIQSSDGVWVMFEGDQVGKELNPLIPFLTAQIKTVCVMLDAKVTEHEVVRQPTALQAKRLKNGKLPLYDFHVVDLSRRAKARRGEAHPTGVKVRLHFRRGHWRHYADHRTWINWMMVGDPDLGFVEKEYRL